MFREASLHGLVGKWGKVLSLEFGGRGPPRFLRAFRFEAAITAALDDARVPRIRELLEIDAFDEFGHMLEFVRQQLPKILTCGRDLDVDDEKPGLITRARSSAPGPALIAGSRRVSATRKSAARSRSSRTAP